MTTTLGGDPVRLPPQLWIDHNESGPPSAARMHPPAATTHGRPHGGLWTSTMTESGSSPWRDRMTETLTGLVPVVRRRAWVLTPAPAHVWEITDRSAELDLMTIAPGPINQIWPTVAQRFDAVRMTQTAAEIAFHRTPALSQPGGLERAQVLNMLSEHHLLSPLDMWDTESTIWFSWRFETIAEAGWLEVPQIPHA